MNFKKIETLKRIGNWIVCTLTNNNPNKNMLPDMYRWLFYNH